MRLEWSVPSRLLLPALALHIPALAYAGAESGADPAAVALACALVAGLGALGAATSKERARTLGPVLGLLLASACYAAFSGRVVEARMHAIIVLAFAAISRDTFTYAISATFALGTQVAVTALRTSSGLAERLWVDTAIFVGFFACAVAANVLWWRTPPRRDRETETAQSLNEALREVERVKTELIAVVSHEFRTPLTSIRGFAQTLERRMDQMDRRTVMSCLDSIDRQARRLERIVANLLVASGDLGEDADEAADVAGVVNTVVHELDSYGPAARSGSAGRRVEINVQPGLGVKANPEAVARIVEHLLDNALKFSHPGTPVRVHGWREGPEAVLEVADQGPSITETDLGRIFDPFVQGDSSDSRVADGIGLGLAIVSGIVAAHGGRVEARNEPPEVILTVRLPAADPGQYSSIALERVGAPRP